MLRNRQGHATPCTHGRPAIVLPQLYSVRYASATRIQVSCHDTGLARLAHCSKHNRTARLQQTRLRAVPVAEVAQIGEQAAELLAILGIAVGGVFVALWNVEKQSKQSVEQEVAAIKDQLAAAQQQVTEVQQQLEAEQKARQEAESWRPRLDDAQKELFKLEKALEMKDAQLATFMTTAHRQIRSLEDNVKELQKM